MIEPWTQTWLVLGSRPGSDVTMVLFGSAGHTALKHTHGPRCGPQSRASALPLIATGTSDIGGAGPICSRVTDMVPATAQAHVDPRCWRMLEERLFPCIVWAHFRTFLDSNFWLFSTHSSSSSLSINYSRPASFYLSLYPTCCFSVNDNHFAVSFFLLPEEP